MVTQGWGTTTTAGILMGNMILGATLSTDTGYMTFVISDPVRIATRVRIHSEAGYVRCCKDCDKGKDT